MDEATRIAELERRLAAALETVEALKESNARQEKSPVDRLAVQKAMSALQDLYRRCGGEGRRRKLHQRGPVRGRGGARREQTELALCRPGTTCLR
jgi:uncharacterized coiled-coil protein SlyX